jgi:tRNA uridine 5-carbamoylmethylation protein Kti12
MPAPDDDPMSSEVPVLIATGPPGVGKTSAAGILAARSDRAVHLEADAFFRFISSGFVEPWTPEAHEQNTTVMRIVAEAAVGYAADGYFTIVEGILIPGWFLEPLRDFLLGRGHPVACAVLRAPLSVCISRVQQREGNPPIDAAAIEQLWRSFADLGDLEQSALDIDGRDSEEVAELLARRLPDGVLRA